MDYSQLSASLTFTADDSMMCVNVTIIDDPTVEGDQSFSVSLQTDVNEPVNLTPNQQAVVVIVDDDSKSAKAKF